MEYKVCVGLNTYSSVTAGDYVEVEYNVKNGIAIDRRVLRVLPTKTLDTKVLNCVDGLVEVEDIAGNTYTIKSEETYRVSSVVKLAITNFDGEEFYSITESGG